MSKRKTLTRVKALLLAIVVVASFLPLTQITALAVPGGGSGNASLDAAIDAFLGGASHNANTVFVLDVSGDENVYGDVDINTLKTLYPNLVDVNLSGTNVTAVTSAAGVNASYNGTFAVGSGNVTGTRSLQNGTLAITYREDAAGDLNVADLLSGIVISTAGGPVQAPAGMFDPAVSGTVTIGTGAPVTVAPNGTIPKNDVIGPNAAGTYTVTLDGFRVKNSTLVISTLTVQLEIKKSGYTLVRSDSVLTDLTVYDGGTAEFVLTKTGPDGQAVSAGALADYVFELDVTVGGSTQAVLTPELKADGKIYVTVKAADFNVGSGGDLIVYDTATPRNELVRLTNVVKDTNPVLDNLRFIEVNMPAAAPGTGPDVMNSATIYINGGTALASKNFSNITGANPVYTRPSTVYHLEGWNTTGAWEPILARYKSQLTVKIGTDPGTGQPYNLTAELVNVINPIDPTKSFLGLVVTATTPTADSYSGTGVNAPVRVELDNGLAPDAAIELDVNIVGNSPAGYRIYQIAESFISSSTNAQDLETAIANADPRVEAIAWYYDDSGAWKLDPAGPQDGAYIVEDSASYFVAAAYYGTNGASYIVPDPLINGWYETNTNMSSMFNNSPPKHINNTSMDAILEQPAANPLASATKMIKVTTDAWGASNSTEVPVEGNVIFAPYGSGANVDFKVTKKEKEIIGYIIAPKGHPTPHATDVYQELEYQKNPANAADRDRLYYINVDGADKIAIGATNEYEVWTLYSNYKVAKTVEDADIGVTLSNFSGADNPLSVEAVTSQPNSEFNIKADSDGGAADARIGETVDMVYTDSTTGISGPVVTLTLKESEITGLFLVYEDAQGKLFSDAQELIGSGNIEVLTSGQNFEVPFGTAMKVYAVWKFANEEFYDSTVDWKDYALVPNNFTLTASPLGIDIGATAGSPGYREIEGAVTMGDNNTLTAAATGLPNTVTINGVTYDTTGSYTGTGADFDVNDTIVTGVYTWVVGSAIAPNTTLVINGKVGKVTHVKPSIYQTGSALSPAFLEAPGDDHRGTITLEVLNSADTDKVSIVLVGMDAYDIGLQKETAGSSFKLVYNYEYWLNGVRYDKVLQNNTDLDIGESLTDSYEITVTIGKPTIDKIYLVADTGFGVPDAPTPNIGGDATGLGLFNEYFLPYTSGGKIRLYPVIMNSLADIEIANGWTPPASIGFGAAATEEKYKFIETADVSFTPTGGNLTETAQNASASFIISTPLYDSNGHMYYEVTFTGDISLALGKYLALEFDITTSSPTVVSGGFYDSTIALSAVAGTGDEVGNLQLFHKEENLYVVDVVADEMTTPNISGEYSVGASVEYDILYSVSVPQAGQFDVPATIYFGASVLPGSSGYNKDSYNHLNVVQESGPAGCIVGSSGNRLVFTPTEVGTYKFNIWTKNSAGVNAPNYAPGYHEITFVVEPYTDTQDIYWGETAALALPSSVTAWGSIVEDGPGTVLDASALSQGVVKMAGNTDDVRVVTVRDAANKEVARITVTTYKAVPQSSVPASLSVASAYASPVAFGDSESKALFWNVVYVPVDTSGPGPKFGASTGIGGGTPYTLQENINNWTFGQAVPGTNDARLSLSGNLVTAAKNTSVTDSIVIYEAEYTNPDYVGLPIIEMFYAKITTASPPPVAYELWNGSNVNTTMITIDVGDVESLWLWEVTGTPTPANVSAATSGNPVVSVAAASAGVQITGIAVGQSTVSVYPLSGGPVTVIVNVKLPTFSVTGDVAEPDGVTPAAGATVTITNGTFTGTATTDSNGDFTLANVPNGVYTITVSDSSGNTGSASATVNNSTVNVGTIILTSAAFTVSPLSVTPSGTVTAPAPITFTVTAAPSAGLSYQWKVSTDNGATWSNVGTDSTAYTIPAARISMDGDQYYCEVTDGTTTISSNTVTITVNPNTTTVTITTQPVNATVNVSDPASFSVTATSSVLGSTLTYRWQVSTDNGATWADIAGATGAAHSIAAAAAAQNGSQYRCVVSDDVSEVISGAATLTVNSAAPVLTIVTQPVSVTVTDPAPATFTIATNVTGGTISYQWEEFDGTTWVNVGTDSPSYTTGATTLLDSYQYRCTVTDGTTTLTSNTAILTVNPATSAIAITTQPAPNTAILAPASATFTITASTTTPLATISYQWQELIGTTWTVIPGEINATYTTGATTAGVYQYRCVVTDGIDTRYSDVAVLTVNQPVITITGQPATALSVTAPASATFMVAATTNSGGTLSYQWQQSPNGSTGWAPIAGATNASYTTGSTTAGTYYYNCVVSDGGLSAAVTSNTAVLTVNQAFITITSQPVNRAVTAPAAATFSVTAATNSGGTLSYQWQQSPNGATGWTNVGTNSPSYTTGATTAGTYYYNCVVSDGGLSAAVTSSTAVLTVSSSSSGGSGGGGGGGSSSAPSYNIIIAAANNGKAVSNRSSAEAGDKITLTVTPSSGYEVDSVTVKDSSGATVTVTKDSNGRYTFTMPAATVTVTAEFKQSAAVSPSPTPGTGDHDCPSEKFIDLDITLWYHEYTDYVLENGIMSGTGGNTFEPFVNLSRSMMVQILYNLEGKPSAAGGAKFADVGADMWYYDAIAWAAGNEIVNGYGDSKFGPNDSVTREQMAAILYRYAKYKGYSTDASDNLSAFADAGDVSEYALPAMRWAVGAGLINGRDATHLAPKGTANRAEVAAIITRFREAL